MTKKINKVKQLIKERDKNVVIEQPSTTSCRFCHDTSEIYGLIKPCKCTGTIAYIHKDCLKSWGKSRCEICHTIYDIPITMFENICNIAKKFSSYVYDLSYEIFSFFKNRGLDLLVTFYTVIFIEYFINTIEKYIFLEILDGSYLINHNHIQVIIFNISYTIIYLYNYIGNENEFNRIYFQLRNRKYIKNVNDWFIVWKMIFFSDIFHQYILSRLIIQLCPGIFYILAHKFYGDDNKIQLINYVQIVSKWTTLGLSSIVSMNLLSSYILTFL